MPSAAAADHPGDPEAMPAGDLAARVRGRGPLGAMAARVLGRREDLVLLDLAEELLPQRPGQPVPGLVRALLTLPGGRGGSAFRSRPSWTAIASNPAWRSQETRTVKNKISARPGPVCLAFQ